MARHAAQRRLLVQELSLEGENVSVLHKADNGRYFIVFIEHTLGEKRLPRVVTIFSQILYGIFLLDEHQTQEDVDANLFID